MVLLACFVGIWSGAWPPGPRRHLLRTPLLLAVAAAAGLLLHVGKSRLEHYVNVGNQGQAEVVFFGTEALRYLEHTWSRSRWWPGGCSS